MTPRRAPHRPRRCGQPLVALAGLIACWIAARAAFIAMPPPPRPAALPVALAGAIPGAAVASPAARTAAARAMPEQADRVHSPLLLRPVLPARPMAAAAPAPPLAPVPARPAALVAGHNLLWMAAMQAVPLPPDLARAMTRAAAGGGPAALARAAPTAAAPRRWSGDGWLLLRGGGAAGALAGPVYGGSQAGAVLRYALAPGSAHRPAAYVRAVTALGRAEGDIAAGLAARPLASSPVTLNLEARASRDGAGGVALRPAAFAAAGFDDAPLPLGLRARGYGQAGYVGGRGATAFADGGAVAERVLAGNADRTAMAAGAGVWGGVQRGAGRLDIGPQAALRFRLGEGTGRLTADYRLRLAGNAAPAAGVAVTISAGF